VGKQPGPKGVEVHAHDISYPALPWPGGRPPGSAVPMTSSTGPPFRSSNGAPSRPGPW
jgi:hypothetical protein